MVSPLTAVCCPEVMNLFQWPSRENPGLHEASDEVPNGRNFASEEVQWVRGCSCLALDANLLSDGQSGNMVPLLRSNGSDDHRQVRP